VDLEPNGRGDFHVGYINQGEWIEYTVDVATAGTYKVSAEIASEQSNGSWTISFGEEASIRMAGIPPTGGWTTHREMVFADALTLAAGEQIMRLDFTGGGAFNVDEITFTLKTTSTEAEATRAGFSVSPNPVVDKLQVRLPAGDWQTGNSRLQLFGADGRQLREYPVAGRATELDLTSFASGTYFLLLTDGTRKLVRRIVR
ncbi:MAG: carbohydrate-binding protein, partial [Bacteroidota bacterium]